LSGAATLSEGNEGGSSPNEELSSNEADITGLGHNLVVWERVLAGAVGLASAGGGGVSVFISNNQAGSTALLLVGGIFLLLAVQGTAIRRATRESLELDPRTARTRVIKKAPEILKEEGADKAEAFMEGAITRDPGLIGDERVVAFNARIFEESVIAQIEALGLDKFEYKLSVAREVRIQSYQFDAVIKRLDREDAWIVAEVMYASQRFTGSGKLQSTMARVQAIHRPGLIISNRHMSQLQQSFFSQASQDPPLHFVLWRTPDDNLALIIAITKLMTYYE
jgi:hypothetical protein